jgi:hypothetical protein
MSVPRDPSARLQRLESIFALTAVSSSAKSGDTEPADTLLASVPIDRIRQATLELQRRTTAPDDLETVTMRLVLNQYMFTVANLRAVTQLAARRIADATACIEQSQQFIRRALKHKTPDSSAR